MSLELINLQVLKNGTALFDPVNLTINPGEITAIMGPSGCGKSTLLSAICGSLDDVFTLKGGILLNNTDVTYMPMEEREIGILFQDDLLFPHLNIFSNLSFAIRENIPGRERRQIIKNALKTAELEGYEKRDPGSLSGGQKARISLLRSLLAKPSALLLDEPFSKLDKQLRSVIKTFVFSQIKKMQIPGLLVTHDPADCPEDGQVLNL